MKKTICIFAIVLLLAAMIGCKTKTVYVPVEKWQTEIEMLDRWHRDSVYIHDSIFVAHKGDTIFLEKYKYIYRDKVVRDSIYKTDSIHVEVPYPVIETREVNRLHTWQIILMCLGGMLIGWGAFRLVRIFRP